MERSMQVQNRMLDVSSSTISPGTPPVDESADSDGDSVSSKVSRASQKRRSVRGVSKEVNTKRTCGEGECSCAGVGGQGKRARRGGLTAIEEEEEEWDEGQGYGTGTGGQGAIDGGTGRRAIQSVGGASQVTEFEITLRFRVTSANQVQVHAVPEARE